MPLARRGGTLPPAEPVAGGSEGPGFRVGVSTAVGSCELLSVADRLPASGREEVESVPPPSIFMSVRKVRPRSCVCNTSKTSQAKKRRGREMCVCVSVCTGSMGASSADGTRSLEISGGGGSRSGAPPASLCALLPGALPLN